MAAAEGMVTVELPGRAGRHPRPQRPAAGGVGRRDDGRRRPDADLGAGARARRASSPASSTSTTSRRCASCARGQPLRVHRPPGAVDARRRRGRRRREPGLQGAGHPARPDAQVPRPATSPPTWSGSWAPTSRSAASSARSTSCSPARTVGALRGRRRQPDPAGGRARSPAVDGTDLHTTIDRDLQWYTQRVLRQTVEDARGRVRRSPSSWTAVPASCWRWPTTRPSTPTTRLQSPKSDRGSRAMSDAYEPGSVEKVLTLSSLIDAGQGHPAHPVHGARRARRRGPRRSTTGSRTALIHLTLAGVIAQSSNIGTVLAADEVRARASSTTTCAGSASGSRTDIGVRGESPGILPPTGAPGPARSRTGSPSASRSRSTPSRWPRRSTPSPTVACGSPPA